MATTFTVGGGDAVRPYSQAAGSVRILSFPEAASQTFVPGELLINQGTGSNKNNQVKQSGNNPTAGIIGFAVHGATGVEFTGWSGAGKGGRGSRTDVSALTAGDPSSLGPGIAGSLGLGVGPSYQNVGNVATLTGNGATRGLIQVYLATPESLFVVRSVSGQAISNDHIGLQYALTRDATNLIWRLDNTNTTNKAAQVVALFDNDGDTNGRYIIKIVAAASYLFGER
jgi:hypothetical protein